MPAKHTARPLGPARIFLSAAAALLVMLVVWIAVRAVGPAEAARQPTVVLPVSSSPSLSDAPSLPPVVSPSPSSASPSPSPSRSSARPTATSHSSSPSRSSSPEKTATSKPTKPTPRAGFAVTVSVTASWDQGYVASVRVQNTGNATGSWTVTVSHANLSNLRLVGTWGNARGTQSGDNVVIAGGPLAAGGSASFGYQVSKTGRGNARPSGCSVVGGKCGVS